MENFNYIDLAGKTNNSDYNGIKQRIVDEDLIETMAFLLSFSMDASTGMDKLKKLMFYGKEPKETSPFVEEALDFNNEDVLKRLDDPKVIDIIHGVIGIFTEAGELVEALRNHLFKDKELDIVNLSEEVGDTFWYSALIAKHANKTFEEIQLTNIRKLAKRFPDGFTEVDAKTRNLIAERKILEE